VLQSVEVDIYGPPILQNVFIIFVNFSKFLTRFKIFKDVFLRLWLPFVPTD